MAVAAAVAAVAASSGSDTTLLAFFLNRDQVLGDMGAEFVPVDRLASSVSDEKGRN